MKCAVCKTEFLPRTKTQVCCSLPCKGKRRYLLGQVTTATQYERISGNWERYLSRLLYFNGRKRDNLTREILMAQLIKQNFKCALTGVPLTCVLEKGVSHETNVSVDRKVPGGDYVADNIQLVCKAVNKWRSNLSVDEFVNWCELVVKHNRGNKNGN